ncbi:hypothetical protein GUJ93_ZPchr0002g25701 [Zizania palustris]|uniref:Uncharacterized protein n=1 Tax=Zizania palustris TaxID=103762 RepID=A0A8J5VCP0_ZIZPA|nr:hypothetical protein GUJ93_ZPchr0002g25701 [Zizania palustris]
MRKACRLDSVQELRRALCSTHHCCWRMHSLKRPRQPSCSGTARQSLCCMMRAPRTRMLHPDADARVCGCRTLHVREINPNGGRERISAAAEK